MSIILKRAIDYVKKNVAIDKIHSVHLVDDDKVDEIIDTLEEYGEENDMPEGWWMDYGDIYDIIAMIVKQ